MNMRRRSGFLTSPSCSTIQPLDIRMSFLNLPRDLTMPQISVLSVSVILSLAYLWWDPLPPPKQLVIHPSISASSDVQNELQKRFKELYPEEYYQGGAYAALPYGKTRYYLLGPDDAPKVSPSSTYHRSFSILRLMREPPEPGRAGVRIRTSVTCHVEHASISDPTFSGFDVR